MTLAVLGLGAMGLPIAQGLAAEVLAVRGFEPLPASRKVAAAAGLDTAATPAGADASAEVVMLAVRDQVQAEPALFETDGAMPAVAAGASIMLTSTIGVEEARRPNDRLALAGVALVDAPVSGGPARAACDDLLIMVGALDAAIEAVRAVLDQLGSSVTVVGRRVGDGQLKVVNQLLAGRPYRGRRRGDRPGGCGRTRSNPAGRRASARTRGSFMLSDRGPRMVEALTGIPPLKSEVGIFVKEFGVVCDLARANGGAVPVAAAAGTLFGMAAAARLSTSDDYNLVTVLLPRNRSEL